jgi:hypothetical protein
VVRGRGGWKEAEGASHRALKCSPDDANNVIPARPGCVASQQHATVLMTLLGDTIVVWSLHAAFYICLGCISSTARYTCHSGHKPAEPHDTGLFLSECLPSYFAVRFMYSIRKTGVKFTPGRKQPRVCEAPSRAGRRVLTKAYRPMLFPLGLALHTGPLNYILAGLSRTVNFRFLFKKSDPVSLPGARGHFQFQHPTLITRLAIHAPYGSL